MTRFQVALWLAGAASLVVPCSLAAQTRWVDLGDVGGHRTAIDTTATVRAPGGHVTVRLRLYDFAGAGVDQIETPELDCRGERSRRLAAREIVTPRFGVPGADSLSPQPTADSTWKQFAPGSLGREQVRAVCRFLRAPAAHGHSRDGAGA
jgi:hypothetical protein